jgi:hypothetical protein
MQFTLEHLRFLTSAEGKRVLQETAVTPLTPATHLQTAAKLRRQLPPDLAQAVLETVLLRQLGAAKFSRAEEMFFTRPALEQASSEQVAQYRADRFARLGVQNVVDLCCSIGGDALALAAGSSVVGVDWDPVRLAMAAENVQVYGRASHFRPLQADVAALSPLQTDAVFFDPARRDEQGRRFYSVHQYQPPLSVVAGWRQVARGTAVKISPGVDYAELPEDADVEFISVQGEVKEAVLWYDDLRDHTIRKATLLPGGHTLSYQDMPPEKIGVTKPRAFLYEPDGAVIRAHLVEALAAQLHGTKIDEEIAYITTDARQVTPFARGYRLEDFFPFQLKRLRAYLRERNVGRVTVKKRGSPLEPEWLQKQLRLKGDEHRVVFLTYVEGETAVLIGQQLTDTQPV